MNRSEILSVFTKHFTDALPDVTAGTLDTHRTMKEMGANSLDIVEIVSRTMRELKVKIPRSELGSLKNIDALLDVLERAASHQ